jgi:hypothetical protein
VSGARVHVDYQKTMTVLGYVIFNISGHGGAGMQNAENKPHGVGGWLAVLVYWLIVIGPALGLLMLFGTISLQLQDSTLSPQAESSQLLYLNVLDGVTWITQSGLSIYAGRRLRDRFEPASVRYAILILWFNSIGVAVLQFLALAILPSSDAASLAVFFLGRSLVLIIPVAMWSAYLVFSRRVKSTYYSVAAVAEAPAPEAPILNQSQSPTNASDEQFVLYDERFDWLAMYLIALVPLWLAYSFPVSLILFPAFALIAALRPMRLRLGSFTWSGVFAAGACLLLSPLLLMAAQDSGSDLFEEVSVSDETLNGIRAFVYPFAGIAIMANAWFRAPRFRDSSGSIRQRVRFLRWVGFAVAGLVLVVNLLPRSQAEEVQNAPLAQPTVTEDRFARAERLASAEEIQEKIRLDREAANDLMKRNRLAKELRLTPSEMSDLPEVLRVLEKQGKAPDEIYDTNYVAIELQRLKIGRKCGTDFSERLRQAERAYIQCSNSSANPEMGRTSLCANREYEKLGFPDQSCPQDGPDFICPDPNGPTDAYFISSKQPCE